MMIHLEYTPSIKHMQSSQCFRHQEQGHQTGQVWEWDHGRTGHNTGGSSWQSQALCMDNTLNDQHGWWVQQAECQNPFQAAILLSSSSTKCFRVENTTWHIIKILAWVSHEPEPTHMAFAQNLYQGWDPIVRLRIKTNATAGPWQADVSWWHPPHRQGSTTEREVKSEQWMNCDTTKQCNNIACKPANVSFVDTMMRSLSKHLATNMKMCVWHCIHQRVDGFSPEITSQWLQSQPHFSSSIPSNDTSSCTRKS